MRVCNEEPDKYGHYNCGDANVVDGVRVCPDHCIAEQINYAGHPFCACLGREFDGYQLRFDFVGGDNML